MRRVEHWLMGVCVFNMIDFKPPEELKAKMAEKLGFASTTLETAAASSRPGPTQIKFMTLPIH